MSILHHLCETCGHPDYFHSSAECSYGHCACRVDAATMTVTPVLGPTWATDSARTPILTVTPPGTRWPTQGQGHKTCACDRCEAEYARLTGAGR